MSNLVIKNPVIKYYLARVMRYPKWFFAVAVYVPLTVLVNSYLPALIVASVLSSLAAHHFHAHEVWASYGHDLIAYVILVFAGIFLWRVVDHFTWKLEGHVGKDIAENVFSHLVDESADFHANHFTGTLVSQTNKLGSGYVRVADTTVYQVYPMIASLFIVSIILYGRSPVYVLGLICFSIFYLIGAILIARPVQRKGNIFSAAESKQTGLLADAITNITAVKSFGNTDYENARFARSTSDSQHKLYMFARALKIQLNILGFISRSISSLAFVVAVVSVVAFKANIGTVFLILSYTSSIVDQLLQFSNNSLRNYSRAIGDASEMVKIVSTKPLLLDPAKPQKVRISSGRIEFKNVTFTHNGATAPIFTNLAMKIKAGEKVGLVGHSGSGKTTITRLLLRFSDVESGEILIDGQSIAKIKQDDLHQYITYVPQEPLLFHRSIAENISYGKLDAKMTEIKKVAYYAHASGFISALPDGYHTMVGERGVKLSGGQRQRVAIARAMLKDAPILLLDEATSALDSESEVLIQDGLWKLMEAKTAIVIAHRLSTIQKMDRIIVLHDGKIIEEGSHRKLLDKGGAYARLWAHQTGGFVVND